MNIRKFDVCIIGAGPSGLMLGHLLAIDGVKAIVLEAQTKEHVLGRIRAGVLESVTTQILTRLGLDERMNKEGLRHDGFVLTDGESERQIRIDLAGLTGRHVTIYGQTELSRDLTDAAVDRDVEIVWEAKDVAVNAIDTDRPFVEYTAEGNRRRIDARFIAGCDGFHGVSRHAIGAYGGSSYELRYPFGWLGVLADVPPCHSEIIYASHNRGFALASMRSPTRSRYYIQASANERIEDWPDERFWDEVSVRLGADAGGKVTRGTSIEKSIAPLRSFVFEPLQSGSMFLAGDAAHIVPPTGAKGLNLAASDVTYLSEAMIAFFRRGEEEKLKAYSAKALARVWKSERFSWSLTKLTHRFPDECEFERRMKHAELDYLANSVAMQKCLAENYVGLPI